MKPDQMSNGSDELPLNCTVPFIMSGKDFNLCSLGRQPIFGGKAVKYRVMQISKENAIYL